jgi:predicted anti-sigma-YlaC factor YlaD
VDCDVAREALSARLDGEREPVPSRRVDEHLATCAGCRDWLSRAQAQSGWLRPSTTADPLHLPSIDHTLLAQPGNQPTGIQRPVRQWPRWALALAGFAQIILAAAQGFGADLGITAAGHESTSAHLVNESTAWSLALGVVMVLAALRPRAAAGLAGVAVVFTAVLTGYVVADSVAGAVTPLRVISHVPVLVGAALAILVWRRERSPHRDPHQAAAAGDKISLPHNASRGRRRGHLWPTDGSAA